MKTTEIRVRPVVRHIVTRYTAPEPYPPGVHGDGPRGSVETLGEFANESYAEQVAEAMRPPPPSAREYVAVEHGFYAETNALYFGSEDEAMAFVVKAAQVGREFRVYSRELTDDVAIAIALAAPIHGSPIPDVPPRVVTGTHEVEGGQSQG